MEVLTEVDAGRLAPLRRRDEFFWVDLVSPSHAELDALGEALGLHPLAVEDTHEFRQRPKVDRYEDHLLAVFYSARTLDSGESDPIEVHIYVSGGYIVTVRHKPCDLLEELHDTLGPAPTDEEDYLVYRIFDTLTDAFFPVITALEERIDALEAEVLARARPVQRPKIYRLRQDVRELQRIAQSQKERFPDLSDAIRGLGGLSTESGEYLRDVGDHLAQIASELQRQVDDLVALAGMYFNANSDRLNAVATRITLGGTFFLVWTLVTGFFGQNFGWLVGHIDGFHRFMILGVGGLVVPSLLLAAVFWVKRNDWF